MKSPGDEYVADCVEGFLASYVAKLVGCSDFFDVFKEAACYNSADDFGCCFLEADGAPVFWVFGVAFTFVD